MGFDWILHTWITSPLFIWYCILSCEICPIKLDPCELRSQTIIMIRWKHERNLPTSLFYWVACMRAWKMSEDTNVQAEQKAAFRTTSLPNSPSIPLSCLFLFKVTFLYSLLSNFSVYGRIPWWPVTCMWSVASIPPRVSSILDHGHTQHVQWCSSPFFGPDEMSMSGTTTWRSPRLVSRCPGTYRPLNHCCQRGIDGCDFQTN